MSMIQILCIHYIKPLSLVSALEDDDPMCDCISVIFNLHLIRVFTQRKLKFGTVLLSTCLSI